MAHVLPGYIYSGSAVARTANHHSSLRTDRAGDRGSSRRSTIGLPLYPSEGRLASVRGRVHGRTHLLVGASTSTTPPYFSSMRLADARLTVCADSPMLAHECRSLCHRGHMLRKGLLPPDFETVGGGNHTRMRLSVVQPSAQSEDLTALRVQLPVRIYSVLFPP